MDTAYCVSATPNILPSVIHTVASEPHSGVNTSRGIPGLHQESTVPNESVSSFLEQIVRTREYQAASVLVHGSDQSPLAQRWHALFGRIFLSENSDHESIIGPRDDLLFFVNKKASTSTKPLLQVHRRNSSKLPGLDNPLIDWEETLYLNLLMQFFVYVVTVAVCTRTGPQELQILNKFSETVYASPSHRRMDNKGDSEVFAYPDLYFNVDNYEEVFSNCVLRDCECLCVELTAYDLGGRLQGVCFLGAIQYGSLKRLYESKAHPTHMVNNCGFLGRRFGSMSITQLGQSAEPAATKFLQLLGPQARGLVELAVICLDESEESYDRQDDPQLASMCCACRDTFPPDETSYGIPTSDVTDGSSGFTPSVSEPLPFRRIQSFGTGTSCYAAASLSRPNEFLPTVNCSHLTSLQPFPCSVKSAGASSDTSPVRTWRHSCSRVFHPRDPFGFVGRRGKMGGTYCKDISHHRTSRVSQLLTRFTHCGIHSSAQLSSTSSHSKPDEACLGPPICSSEREFSNVGSEADPWTIPGENFPPEHHGRVQGSFAQSWSWFKERRRLTSARLSTGLTFISLPCHSLLSDLLERKREPILNIVY